MTVEGVDYSFSRPSPICLYSNGKRFACRYLSYDTNTKNLTHSEALSLSSAGLWIVCNWEAVADGALNGYSEGVRAATHARALAVPAGQPADRPIYFSMDFDATTSELSESRAYFEGVADTIGIARVGVYGGYNTIDYFQRNKIARWFWQTYAWSGGKVHSGIHLYQWSNNHSLCGGSVDYTRAMVSDYGQWKIGEAVGVPASPPQSGTVTVGAWDYTGIISGTASEFLSIGNSLNSVTSGIDALRNN